MNNSSKLEDAMEDAKMKALKALAGYKFLMFGYHAAIWVNLNKISGLKRPNPFAALVEMAKAGIEIGGQLRRYPGFLGRHEE